MPFGMPRSVSGRAVGAAVIVVVRERRRVMSERVGMCILLEGVGRRDGVGGCLW